MKLDPWHDCPPCPECSLTTGTPASESHPEFAVKARDVLFCGACGHSWHEDDATLVEQAWKAWRAWEREEARQERVAAERKRAEKQRADLIEYERVWGKR